MIVHNMHEQQKSSAHKEKGNQTVNSLFISAGKNLLNSQTTFIFILGPNK
jgi:hypothetical protein